MKQKIKIKPRAFKGEDGIWLVAVDIISTDPKEQDIRILLTTELATELANEIKFANYTAKSQNLKNP